MRQGVIKFYGDNQTKLKKKSKQIYNKNNNNNKKKTIFTVGQNFNSYSLCLKQNKMMKFYLFFSA